MARNQVSHRLKASSLIEVIIAMVVIVVIFSTAMMIFSNVLLSSPSARKLRARATLKDALVLAEGSGGATDSTYQAGELTVERRYSAYPAAPALYLLRISVLGTGAQDSIAVLRKVVSR